ncbi:MAG: hypothetical protein Q8M37_03415 [Nevskia sp.]|nr:hypothetical protein [Nevskia sp.]
MNINLPESGSDGEPSAERWPYIRDVLVFQLKLTLGNVLNVVLLPVSIIAAIYSLFAKKPGRLGTPFYEVLDIARDLEERINIYGAVGGYHATGSSSGPASAHIGDTTVDDVVRKVEDVIVREFSTGGTAASAKAAVNRLLDEIRNRKR